MIDLNNNRKCTTCGGVTDSIIKHTGDFHCSCPMIPTPVKLNPVSTKEQLLHLAIETGFKSELLKKVDLIVNPYFHKEINELNYYLWMSELQKWLRDNRGIVVDVYQESRGNKYTGKWKVDRSEVGNYQEEEFPNPAILNACPEKTLELGLIDALNLINNGKEN